MLITNHFRTRFCIPNVSIIVASFVMLISCRSESVPGDQRLDRTYVLYEIGNQALPVAVSEGGPVILSAGKGVDVMARVDANIGRLGKTAGSLPDESALYDSYIVMARQNNLLVSSFHPELTDDLRVHNYFLQMVEGEAPSGVSSDTNVVHKNQSHKVNPMALSAV